MTVRGSAEVSLFAVGGYDLLSSLMEITVGQEAITENTKAPFGTGWDTHAWVNMKTGSIGHTGYYDDGVNSAHEALSANLAQVKVLCYADQGTATGSEFTGFSGAITTRYVKAPKRGELTKAEGVYKVSGQIDKGKMLHTMKAATASGRFNSVLSATVSSTGAVGYLQVPSMTLLSHATVKILHSSDDITYATLMTFAACTASNTPTAQRITTTGKVEPYVAADVTFASASSTGAAITYFAGISRV